MITTTLGALVNAEPALIRLSEIRLPIKIAYQIGKLIRTIAGDIGDFHIQRDAFIRQYGGPAENNQITVLPEHISTFLLDMNELSSTSVTIDMQPLDLNSFGTVDISPADLIALMPILKEEVLSNGE